MASSAAVIDIDTLLAPIPGDNPAGEPVPYDVRAKLEEDRKEEDPADYADDDPMRPEQFKKADWPHIIRLGTEVLSQQSRDLLLAARLTEALVKVHGFSGLRDGLRLLRRLVEECWDRLNPVMESEDDLELRAGPFHWLDDPDKGARFPNTVRGVPVAFGEDGAFSWLDWKLGQDGRGSVSREEFEKGVLNTPTERYQTLAEDLNEAAQELNQLGQALAAKMAHTAPGLTGLRQAVEECRTLIRQILQRRAPETTDEDGGATSQADGQATPKGGGRAAVQSAVVTRAEAYRQLQAAASLLQQLEPHSPIPYLVQRAVQLGSLPFPELIKALIREQAVLAELNRELGITQEPKASE